MRRKNQCGAEKRSKKKAAGIFSIAPLPPLLCRGTFADWLEWLVNSDHTTSELRASAGPQPSVSPRR